MCSPQCQDQLRAPPALIDMCAVSLGPQCDHFRAGHWFRSSGLTATWQVLGELMARFFLGENNSFSIRFYFISKILSEIFAYSSRQITCFLPDKMSFYPQKDWLFPSREIALLPQDRPSICSPTDFPFVSRKTDFFPPDCLSTLTDYLFYPQIDHLFAPRDFLFAPRQTTYLPPDRLHIYP